MPTTTTPNYALGKPGVGEAKDTWGGLLNENADKIDAALKALSNTLALKLAASGYTAADVLAKLLTVDGNGSTLDADTVDGQHASAFAPANSVTAAGILAALLTVDGAGSGLDADFLDGQSSAAFAAAAHTHLYLPLAGGTVTGDITREGAGDYLHHVTPAFGSGRLFTTEGGASSPMTLPGDVWIKLKAL